MSQLPLSLQANVSTQSLSGGGAGAGAGGPATPAPVSAAKPGKQLRRSSSSTTFFSWNSVLDLPDLRLMDVLRNKTRVPVSRNCFKMFLQQDHSVENLKFWYRLF